MWLYSSVIEWEVHGGISFVNLIAATGSSWGSPSSRVSPRNAGRRQQWRDPGVRGGYRESGKVY